MATKSGVKSLKRDKGHILKCKTFYTKLRILALLLQQWEMNLMHDYDVNEAVYQNYEIHDLWVKDSAPLGSANMATG